MVDSQLTSQFSSEVLDAVRRDAARDADDAADILDALGFTGRNASVPPIRLPPAFLLGVGAAARLIRWEAGGIVIHRDAALPKAEDLVKWLFLRLQDLSTGDTR